MHMGFLYRMLRYCFLLKRVCLWCNSSLAQPQLRVADYKVCPPLLVIIYDHDPRDHSDITAVRILQDTSSTNIEKCSLLTAKPPPTNLTLLRPLVICQYTDTSGGYPGSLSVASNELKLPLQRKRYNTLFQG